MFATCSGVADHLRHLGSLAQRAHNLIVIQVPDQDQRVAVLGKADRLHVHLGHQRTGRVDHPQQPQLGSLPHRRRNAVSAVDHALAVRHLVHVVHKDGALALQVLDHILVVHDFLAHVDRRPEGLQSDAHNVDGAHHARAESARLQKQKSFGFGRLCHRFHSAAARRRFRTAPRTHTARLCKSMASRASPPPQPREVREPASGSPKPAPNGAAGLTVVNVYAIGSVLATSILAGSASAAG